MKNKNLAMLLLLGGGALIWWICKRDNERSRELTQLRSKVSEHEAQVSKWLAEQRTEILTLTNRITQQGVSAKPA